VANPPGKTVSSFAEGKEALKDGKINYDGASSVLDFDAKGDVKPDFGVFVFEKGQMNRKYVVKI
jgi:branched-chain amino acid transport system substrate-binding protein